MPTIVKRGVHLPLVANLTESLVFVCDRALENETPMLLAFAPAAFKNITRTSLGENAVAMMLPVRPFASVFVTSAGVGHSSFTVGNAVGEGAGVIVAECADELALAVVGAGGQGSAVVVLA